MKYGCLGGRDARKMNLTLPSNYDFLGRWFAREMGVEKWYLMQLENFDYILPEELIAQHPAVTRDASRLMQLDRQARKASIH